MNIRFVWCIIYSVIACCYFHWTDWSQLAPLIRVDQACILIRPNTYFCFKKLQTKTIVTNNFSDRSEIDVIFEWFCWFYNTTFWIYIFVSNYWNLLSSLHTLGKGFLQGILIWSFLNDSKFQKNGQLNDENKTDAITDR